MHWERFKMEKKKNVILEFFKKDASFTSIFLALILISIVWSILTPFYFTAANFKNILVYISANGIMAAGLTVTLVLGGLDLSQMSLMALAGMVAAIGYEAGLRGPVLFLIAILVGIIGGAINGILVTYMGINPFIATLATQLAFRGLAFIVTNGRYITITDPMIRFIGFKSVLGLPSMFWIMLTVYIAIGFIMKFTQYGRNIYSVGGNRVASRLSGISVKKVTILSFVISGLTAGIASILYIAQGSVALNNAGTGNEMDIMTAAILGGLSLAGGKGTVLNTFMGVVLLSVIANGMGLLSISSYYQMLIKGLILIVAVFIDHLREAKN